MCDDSAVSWSEFEAHKREIESRTRAAMTEELLELLRISEKNGDPECYVQGIKRALDLLQSRNIPPAESDHPSLF